MRFACLVITSLLLSSCAGRTCPAVDETALASAIVDELERRAGARGEDSGEEEPAEDPIVDLSSVPWNDLPCRGPANASVRLLVASDFECPFCSRVVPSLDRLMRDFEGDLRLCFLHYPLAFHRNAHDAAQAAVEAQRQGGSEAFFALHDWMFANQRTLDDESIIAASPAMGLNEYAMRDALRTRRHANAVDAQLALGTELGVSGTPTTFVGDERIAGAVPYEQFAAAVRRQLGR